MVFRMIHGARIPDPTNVQSLVQMDFQGICLKLPQEFALKLYYIIYTILSILAFLFNAFNGRFLGHFRKPTKTPPLVHVHIRTPKTSPAGLSLLVGLHLFPTGFEPVEGTGGNR